MQLNHDCVRLILLAIEECEDPLVRLFPDFFKSRDEFNDFKITDINYAMEKLYEAKYINVMIHKSRMKTTYIAKSITWEGHVFLDTIRDDSVWKKIKEKSSALKSVSLPIMSNLGTSIVKNILGLS